MLQRTIKQTNTVAVVNKYEYAKGSTASVVEQGLSFKETDNP
jgi:hypothetical protein